MRRRDDTRLPPAARFRIRALKTRLQVDRDFFTEAADLIEELYEALDELLREGLDTLAINKGLTALRKARDGLLSDDLGGLE